MKKHRIIKRTYHDGLVIYICQKKGLLWGWNTMRRWINECNRHLNATFHTLEDAENYINEYRDEIFNK